MSSKHTPGLWEIEKVSGGWGVRAPNWGYVAIHNTSGLPHWDEGQKANRRLIAAAPDLLAALQVAELALRERGLRACGEYKQIEAALAKATGGA